MATAVVRAAIAVVALHTIDDSFLNPEPGTSAANHLASGLIPTALLALTAWLYPRCRPWAQCALAVSIGLLALTNAIAVSARHIVVDRVGGDDVTGLLAGAAGVVLLVCGAHAVRHAATRSAAGPRARRYGRRALVAFLVVAAAYFVEFPLGAAIVATHMARAPVRAADLGRPHRDVSFKTSDGLVLRGSYVPSRNGASVIVCPGRRGTLRHTRMLVRHGYGVLIFDRRGEGESQGNFNAFGWSGEPDLRAAASYVARQPDIRERRVGGLGLSVGGELLLQTAAHTSLFKAVVADGAGYRSIRDHLAVDGRGMINWISPLATQTLATAVLSDSPPPAAVKNLVARIHPSSAFFIWAGRGNGGENWNPAYYRAARQPKQIWEIPEAGHTGGLRARPAEYERRVVGFFDHYLLEAGSVE